METSDTCQGGAYGSPRQHPTLPTNNDLPDLVAAIEPRPVTVRNPVDQLEKPNHRAGQYRARDNPAHEFLR